MSQPSWATKILIENGLPGPQRLLKELRTLDRGLQVPLLRFKPGSGAIAEREELLPLEKLGKRCLEPGNKRLW